MTGGRRGGGIGLAMALICGAYPAISIQHSKEAVFVEVTCAEIFPVARIAAAHELIESGRALGRVLVSLPWSMGGCGHHDPFG